MHLAGQPLGCQVPAVHGLCAPDPEPDGRELLQQTLSVRQASLPVKQALAMWGTSRLGDPCVQVCVRHGKPMFQKRSQTRGGQGIRSQLHAASAPYSEPDGCKLLQQESLLVSAAAETLLGTHAGMALSGSLESGSA